MQAGWDVACPGTVSILGSRGSDEGRRAGISGHYTQGFQKRMFERQNS